MNFLLLHLAILVLTVSASPAPFLLKRQNSGLNGIKHIPAQAAQGNTQALFTSQSTGLDGPKLSAVNETSFNWWWYFDVVSTDLKRTLVIVFYAALSSAFPFLPDASTVTTVAFYATFANGTFAGTYLNATEAVITTVQQSSSGDYVGSGAKWHGELDLSSYSITINSPSNGIVGSFNLTSRAPAHYPCGPAGASQTMLVGPHIGWSNAIPDATGIADFTIFGSSLCFSGVAYHDENWGDQPFQNNVASWYWGHARLGPYSLVWFSYLSLSGTKTVSSYIAPDNQILSARCAPNSVLVRPINGAYPPTIADGPPTGFSVKFISLNGLQFNFNVTIKNVVGDAAPFYTRWTGEVTGRYAAQGLITGGEAMLEQFVLVE